MKNKRKVGTDTSIERNSEKLEKFLKRSEDNDGVKIDFDNPVEKLEVEVIRADFVDSTQSVHAG